MIECNDQENRKKEELEEIEMHKRKDMSLYVLLIVIVVLHIIFIPILRWIFYAALILISWFLPFATIITNIVSLFMKINIKQSFVSLGICILTLVCGTINPNDILNAIQGKGNPNNAWPSIFGYLYLIYWWVIFILGIKKTRPS